MSDLFKLNTQDLIRGLVVSVFGAVLAYFSNPTMDLGMIDWGYVVKIAVITGLSYLGKNLLSDSSGKLGGII